MPGKRPNEPKLTRPYLWSLASRAAQLAVDAERKRSASCKTMVPRARLADQRDGRESYVTRCRHLPGQSRSDPRLQRILPRENIVDGLDDYLLIS